VILVIQRVKKAEVAVRGETVGRIGGGMLVLAGVEKGDAERDIVAAADKVAHLRIFDDGEGKMNLALADVGGEVLVVSQFTLAGSIEKGRRPSFDNAAPPDLAKSLYETFVSELSMRGLRVETGVFQEVMEVSLVNDGPVTFVYQKKGGGCA
jgi:D-tyrosyl-tRNA(Tyr) deacylase